MNWAESFSLAFHSIRMNKMRSFLTMLGIIIGVSAVFIIAGLGNGMTKYVQKSFDSFGMNLVDVRLNTKPGSPRSVSMDEFSAFISENSTVFGNFSPTVFYSGTVRTDTKEMDYTQAMGVGEHYLSMKDYEVQMGRGLAYFDSQNREKLCVIGSYTADQLFDGDALGKQLQIGENNFTVIGVLAQKAEKTAESGGQDDMVFIPYTTAARLSKIPVNSYSLSLMDQNQLDSSMTLLKGWLYDNLGDSKLYTVNNMGMYLDEANQMIGIMVFVLTFIAAISLVVGGIGIMNIMLVSVTERTREIGIRKSLGARESYILQQFIIEAATTSGVGGLLGIAFGFLISSIASIVITNISGSTWSVIPNASAVLVAFGISVAIGVFFGWLPAKKAAVLNPIDALHY